MDHLRQLPAAPALSRASRPRRLRRGIMALLAGMLLVTLLGIGAGVFLFTSRNEQRVWQGRQAEAARYAGQIVASFMQTTRNSLTLVGVLHGDDPATEPDLLRRLIEQNPALLELIHVDSNGRAVAGIYQDAPVLTNLFTIAQSGWFLEAKAGRTYLGDVQISADSEPYLIMAIPAPDGDVVAARLSLKKLWEVVRGLRFGDTGRTYVVNLGGDVLAHTDPEVALANTNISGRPEMTALSQAPNREWSGSYQNFVGAQVVGVTLPVAGSDWVVITEVSQHEARAISSSAVRLLGGGMLLFGVLITGAAARFLERMIFRPLEELRDGAERLGGGDLSQRIPSARRDEVGQVARAFNQMAGELQGLYASLEQQVAHRTLEMEQRSAYLEASAEVGRAATSILESGELIHRVVELIRERFGLYYVGLFLLDPMREWAVLRAGSGAAGQAMLARGHRIRVGEGMVGWSIAHAQARVAAEISQDAARLATSELPDTQSEAALPLRSRGQVLGAMTVQQAWPGAFDTHALAALQAMADQVAVALDNARLFSESQVALEAMRRAYGEISRQAWAEMTRARHDLGVTSDERGLAPAGVGWQPWMIMALQKGETAPGQDETPVVATPIKVRGQVIGVIDAYKREGADEWTAEEIELLETLSDQLGVALDSARLFEDTQRRAARERLTGEITARMRETLDVDAVLQTAIREMGEALGMAEVEVRMTSGLAAQPPAAASGTNGHSHAGGGDDSASLSKGIVLSPSKGVPR